MFSSLCPPKYQKGRGGENGESLLLYCGVLPGCNTILPFTLSGTGVPGPTTAAGVELAAEVMLLI